MPFGEGLRPLIQLHEDIVVILNHSPGLDRKYSTNLANYIAGLRTGECLYWRPDGWYMTAPGIAFVKTEEGGIRPQRNG